MYRERRYLHVFISDTLQSQRDFDGAPPFVVIRYADKGAREGRRACYPMFWKIFIFNHKLRQRRLRITSTVYRRRSFRGRRRLRCHLRRLGSCEELFRGAGAFGEAEVCRFVGSIKLRALGEGRGRRWDGWVATPWKQEG